ncbi:hypothetical protein I5V32_05040 [Stenotrophomonas maltophilia]|uniref:Uncharacterized protein n=1 Tax=Stenotrophomonas maltophilia TaxID=40324 RepID=A0AA40Y464_STEMA|nr:hypothetical protein B7H26_19795 [Stenotrophomonas maltophilia]MBH1360106.1 hypothetical protein [Stenotrophomonas maltophilia]MBH1584499.1 hypothetical protein [Stenotrophomonas maltophilia]MBH1715515.1 hypothetical protein [Stenotrophomonas maltophilia]MBH1790592.1 hypothetical protein [Stenotrophomonas maltophilia]
MIHDCLHWSQLCPRKQADNLMLIAMKESNVSTIDHVAIHMAVRKGAPDMSCRLQHWSGRADTSPHLHHSPEPHFGFRSGWIQAAKSTGDAGDPSAPPPLCRLSPAWR